MDNSKIEVLVAAMYQSDFSLVDKMNLKTNVVIGNQGNFSRIEKENRENSRILMISTEMRGVGINRNIALEFAEGDILLFADEDCSYSDDLEEKVLNAFCEFPEAEVILFGSQFTKNGLVYKKRVPSKGRICLLKSLKFGTYSIAVRKKVIKRYNMHFSELFGGGCIYSHGEDTDFLIQCFKNHLKVYSYNDIICTTSKDSSTCFEGYTEKYYYDVGALAKHSFKILAIPYMLYIAIRTKESSLKLKDKLYFLSKGYSSLRKMERYRN